jgi:sulfur-oxidizing protein SoxZ
MLRTIIRFVPPKPKKGDIVEVRSRVQHAMETGHRRDERGKVFPRDILHRMVVTYAGETVFEAEMHPAMAANPYIAFHMRAKESGPLVFAWTGDDGKVETVTANVVVE